MAEDAGYSFDDDGVQEGEASGLQSQQERLASGLSADEATAEQSLVGASQEASEAGFPADVAAEVDVVTSKVSLIAEAPTPSTTLQQLSRGSFNASRLQRNSDGGLPQASVGAAAPAVVGATPAGSTVGKLEGASESPLLQPPVPGYLLPTQVLPKSAHQEYTNAASEHIASVFSTGTTLTRGIRSLPDALSPNFRQQLYEEIIESGRLERSGQAPLTKAPYLSGGPEGGPMLAPGLRPVPRAHPHAGTFTTYEYMPSEYDRQRLISKFDRLRHKLSQVIPTEFVVKAMPSAPKSAPAFCEYEYTINPYEGIGDVARAKEAMEKARIISGPFFAGGKLATGTALQGCADDCMLALCKALSTDWPTSFLQIFEDRTGSIVVSFDKTLALAEGDLAAYMHNTSKNNAVITQYHLAKDATQWGIVDTDTQSVFYVLWPPWVRHRYMGTPSAEGETAAAAPLAA